MTELGELSVGASLLERGDDSRYRLRGSRCPSCGDVRIPPRRWCPKDSTSCNPLSLTGAGKIYEAVRIVIPPQGFDNPFWVGYIDLDEGPRFFAQIACAEGESPPRHGELVQMNVEWIGTPDHRVLAPVFARVGH
jgi:uncharacterized OB-fold protein